MTRLDDIAERFIASQDAADISTVRGKLTLLAGSLVVLALGGVQLVRVEWRRWWR